MNPEQFLQHRQADWQRFSQLLERSQSRAEQLSPEEVKILGQLYRAITADFALAQREFPRHPMTTYLNQQVGRGHALIYRSEPFALNRLARFVTHRFPQVYRETFPYTLTAILLFLIPAIVSGLILNWQPAAAEWLLPVAVRPVIPMIEEKELWINMPPEERPFDSAFIMTNNIQVSFIAFAGGMTAGLLTVYAMIYNGLMLGGLTGLTAYHDIGFELWTFAIGHGVIELNAIFIAGGSGLMMGRAILSPGLLRRRDALTLAARKAVRLIIGCIPLLFIAGAIEGFISPNEQIPWLVKWSVGIISGIVLYGYLYLAGRKG